MNSKKSLLIVINVDWLFLLHRKAIAEKAQKNGFEVIVAAKDTGSSKLIRDAGMKFVNLNMSRSGMNPFQELKLIAEMYKLYKGIKPSIVYHVTLKPVIYGSLVSRFLKIKSVNAISGLGYNFTENRRGIVQKLMIQFMKWGFNKKNNYLVFENTDDLNELKILGVVNHKNKAQVIKGVGVNLEKYKFVGAIENNKVIVLLPSRMLWDKGVKEFVEAAKLLKEKHFGKVFFKLFGMSDSGNKKGVPEKYLKNCEISNYLKWFGYQEDMPEVYSSSDIIVLPSYREGLPTSLIEACATGKPIVTTDAIGCKDCVEEGKNGYKVPVKSIKELAYAIEKLINNPSDRKRMGIYGRKKAEMEFDQKDVVTKHINIFNELLKD